MGTIAVCSPPQGTQVCCRVPGEAANACRGGCDDDPRELHEFRAAAAWSPKLSGKQMQQAQKVVDVMLMRLALGLQVGTDHGSARLSISPDLTALELDAEVWGRESKRRIALIHIADTSFGSSPSLLILRFSDAFAESTGMSSLQLDFAGESERLCFMAALKVLRGRQR